jgi:hypothetical protein
VLAVKIAPWGMLEKETTWMPLNANNVFWVKPPRLKVRPNAICATVVSLVVKVGFVTIVPLGFTKTPKEKTFALNV